MISTWFRSQRGLGGRNRRRRTDGRKGWPVSRSRDSGRRRDAGRTLGDHRSALVGVDRCRRLRRRPVSLSRRARSHGDLVATVFRERRFDSQPAATSDTCSSCTARGRGCPCSSPRVPRPRGWRRGRRPNRSRPRSLSRRSRSAESDASGADASRIVADANGLSHGRWRQADVCAPHRIHIWTELVAARSHRACVGILRHRRQRAVQRSCDRSRAAARGRHRADRSNVDWLFAHDGDDPTVPPVQHLVGWRWAFVMLALGPVVGIAAIRRLTSGPKRTRSRLDHARRRARLEIDFLETLKLAAQRAKLLVAIPQFGLETSRVSSNLIALHADGIEPSSEQSRIRGQCLDLRGQFALSLLRVAPRIDDLIEQRQPTRRRLRDTCSPENAR